MRHLPKATQLPRCGDQESCSCLLGIRKPEALLFPGRGASDSGEECGPSPRAGSTPGVWDIQITALLLPMPTPFLCRAEHPKPHAVTRPDATKRAQRLSSGPAMLGPFDPRVFSRFRGPWLVPLSPAVNGSEGTGGSLWVPHALKQTASGPRPLQSHQL